MPRQKKQQLKKRPDGRYRCAYKGHLFYAYDPDEALALREEYKRQEAAGEFMRENGITVKAYAEEWLPIHKGNVSTKCYNDYKKQLDALSDAIGDIRVKNVSVDDAATVWKHYQGYSASTVKRARMLYVAIFDTAIENDLCRKNPFRSKFAQPPKAPAGTHRVLTEEEKTLIWATPHKMQLAALIMLYCGLRRGEVLALTAEDIDTNAKLLTVNKAIRFEGNQPVLTMPKTASGVRRVPIPNIIAPYFDNFSGLILSAAISKGTMSAGAFINCWNSFMNALSATAGHPVNIRPHDLRHTYCTMLRDAGIDMHQAMIWMGHSDETMILRVYDHVTDKRIQASMNQLNNDFK